MHSEHPNLHAGNILISKCPKSKSSIFGKATESQSLSHRQKLQSVYKDTMLIILQKFLLVLFQTSVVSPVHFIMVIFDGLWMCPYQCFSSGHICAPTHCSCTSWSILRAHKRDSGGIKWSQKMSYKNTVNGIWLLGGNKSLGQTTACLK